MSFVSNFFSKKKRKEVVALIDIGARTVAGACVQYVEDATPVVLYATHLPIVIQKGEEHSAAMLRSVELLCETLVREGIPALVRASAAHSIDAVCVAIDAPWQETSVYVERVEQKEPFIFKKSIVTETVKKVTPPASGKVYTDACVVGTILNGYEVPEPYGMLTKNAKIIILTSLIEESVVDSIRAATKAVSSSKRVMLISGTSLRYQALRVVFKHEIDALILDATGPLPEVALIRKGFLVAVSDAPEPETVKKEVTSDDFMRSIASIAKIYPLPRTLFLLARTDDMETTRKKVDAVHFDKLWLTDSPPKIISILPSHVTGMVSQKVTSAPDLPILLMAVYYRNHNPQL